MLRRCFFRNAYAGQGTQQAIQSVGISLTSFGQVIDALDFVSECIGDTKARSRTKYAAAGICHRHLHECRIRSYIADTAIRLGHKTPRDFGQG
jgi:hypothetical protein